MDFKIVTGLALLAAAVIVVWWIIDVRAASRREREEAARRELAAQADEPLPDQSGSRLIWRPGDGGQP